jgi:hypothetical protein
MIAEELSLGKRGSHRHYSAMAFVWRRHGKGEASAEASQVQLMAVSSHLRLHAAALLQICHFTILIAFTITFNLVGKVITKFLPGIHGSILNIVMFFQIRDMMMYFIFLWQAYTLGERSILKKASML